VGLEVDAIDRMPRSDEAARIILIDASHSNAPQVIDETRAWNPQQGTMLYWNPLAVDTQFFFNDRDPDTGHVFTALYDVEQQRRIREYRFPETPVGNGGVAADGSAWLGINYGRLARLRRVTGYPGVPDWSAAQLAPANDGIFLVDIRSGSKRLLVSYQQLEEALLERQPNLNHTGLFINHTLWNRESDRVYFFVRAGWNGKPKLDRVNQPCSIRIDGSELVLHDTHIGGHPEWAEGSVLIGRHGPRQILYDVRTQQITGVLGTPNAFPNPEGDIALSPDGNWFANGYKRGTTNLYSIFRRSDGAFVRSLPMKKGSYRGDIRIDPAPRWNRTNDAILAPGLADDGTRQMFVIRVSQ